jgi:hypothetical protein
MALYQGVFGDDVAVATPGSAAGMPSSVPSVWTPGLGIAGIAIVAIFFMLREEKSLRRRR